MGNQINKKKKQNPQPQPPVMELVKEPIEEEKVLDPVIQEEAERLWKLGQSFENGTSNQQGKNLFSAFQAYKNAHKLHHKDATYRLSLFYRNGWGVPQNIQFANRLLEDARKDGQLEAVMDSIIKELERTDYWDTEDLRVMIAQLDQLRENHTGDVYAELVARMEKSNRATNSYQCRVREMLQRSAEIYKNPHSMMKLGINCFPDLTYDQKKEYRRMAVEHGPYYPDVLWEIASYQLQHLSSDSMDEFEQEFLENLQILEKALDQDFCGALSTYIKYAKYTYPDKVMTYSLHFSQRDPPLEFTDRGKQILQEFLQYYKEYRPDFEEAKALEHLL